MTWMVWICWWSVSLFATLGTVGHETVGILKCRIVILYYLKVNNGDLDKSFSNNFLIISTNITHLG